MRFIQPHELIGQKRLKGESKNPWNTYMDQNCKDQTCQSILFRFNKFQFFMNFSKQLRTVINSTNWGRWRPRRSNNPCQKHSVYVYPSSYISRARMSQLLIMTKLWKANGVLNPRLWIPFHWDSYHRRNGSASYVGSEKLHSCSVTGHKIVHLIGEEKFFNTLLNPNWQRITTWKGFSKYVKRVSQRMTVNRHLRYIFDDIFRVW